MNKLLLDVKGLKKYFPVTSGIFRRKVGDIKAVDGIDFTVRYGEVVGMVGESGCGKSTAGRAAIRLIEPTAGEIHFEGADIRKFDGKQMVPMRREIQMVFQDPYSSLNPRKTISDAISEGAIYHGLLQKKDDVSQFVADVLERVGLPSDVMDRYPHEFSGGQQQRICIGRAIAMNPKLIVCDEAVSALDVSVQAQILNLFSELQSSMGLSYLFISHDLSVVRHICDRVIVLYLGKVMESAPAEELFRNPKHPYTQALLAAVPCRHPKQKKYYIPLRGEMPSAMHPPTGCPFRTRCPYAQPQCAMTPPVKKVKGPDGQEHIYHCILD